MIESLLYTFFATLDYECQAWTIRISPCGAGQHQIEVGWVNRRGVRLRRPNTDAS